MSFAYPPSQGPPTEGYPSSGNPGDYGPPPVPPSGPSTRFSVYQIDFSAQASGKRIATTKRRIRWRWGFTNEKALEQGLTGTACRGEEHDITIVWSVTSGKRQITMDGQEVHFSTNRSSVIDFSWSMRGNHVMKITAHATPPLTAIPGFRQYDLSVDGQSFFQMTKVFELGIVASSQAHARHPAEASQYGGTYSGEVRSIAESRPQLSRGHDVNRYPDAPQASIRNQSAPSPAPAPTLAPITAEVAVDLLGFDTGPAPFPALANAPYNQPPPAYGQPPPTQIEAMVPYGQPSGYVPPDATPYAQAPPSQYAQPPPQYTQPPPPQYAQPPPQYTQAPPPQYAQPPPQYTQAPPPVPFSSPQSYSNGHHTSFSPDIQSFASAPNPLLAPVQHSHDDPFAPKDPPPQTKYDIHNAILGAYSEQGPPSTPVGGAPAQPNFGTPKASESNPTSKPAFALSMSAPLAITAAGEETEIKSDLEKAMQNLVNFDDLTAPAEKALRLTMLKQEEEKKTTKNGKSRGLPPVAKGLVGSGATLSQIQTVKTTTTLKDPSDIMKQPPQLFHPDSVHAGALVIHGQGPPPIQRGFGVGFGSSPHGYR